MTPNFEDPRLEPIRQKVEAAEPLSFEDGVTLYRSPDMLGVGWMANLRARAPARQRHVLQRESAHQSDRCVRRQLPPMRFRQTRQGSQGLHDVARSGVGDSGPRLD